jgi:hypothetical protein
LFTLLQRWSWSSRSVFHVFTPPLIFKNIDAAGLREGLTVSLALLPQRLRNLGVHLEPDEVTLIKTVAEWRNQLVHYMPKFDAFSVGQQLPRLLDFLSVFLRRELTGVVRILAVGKKEGNVVRIAGKEIKL